MSLDIYLYDHKPFDGDEDYIENELHWDNITHNLGKMANAIGLYKPLWCPAEIEIKYARQLIPILKKGITDLMENRDELIKKHSPSNGWGNYDGLLKFVIDYFKACSDNPDAEIHVSR